MRMLIVILVLIALGAGVGGWYWHVSSKTTTAYRTAEVERGDLLSTISATGTVEPEEVVDVGAQVAGLIQEFGTDANGKQVDYRSPVEKDKMLAKIDDAVYKADLNTAIAQLGQANASVLKGQADLATAQAKLVQAEQNWKRAEKIGPSDALSQNDYDMYKADYLSAQATVSVAEAEIAQAKTSVDQANAEVAKAQRNFEFCTIKSPVKGVIIDRRVNIGQTVVSSLNAPSLFLIAKDLTRMQVWVAVNEADIGHIHPEQNVTFTCDAFPGETFKGTVNKVRLNATMTQNVVTYTVEVDTDNSSGKLLPYLTANLQFEVQKDPNVLMVPNAALRWYPSSVEQVAPDARADFKPVTEEDHGGGGGAGRGAGQGGQASSGSASAGEGAATTQPATKDHPHRQGNHDKAKVVRHGMLWVKEGQFVRPVPVTVGPTDGLNTEVSAQSIKQGDEVVVGEVIAASGNTGERNPFIPQMGNRRGGGRGG